MTGMRRRQFLELFGGLAVAGVPPFQTARGDRIVIAGGGILGAHLAYHLSKRGAAVTLLEKTRPASGATDKSFAWINATFSKQPWSYYYLNRLGMEAWRQIDRELGGEIKVEWGGTLEWCHDAEAARKLGEEVRRHQAWGYAAYLVDEARLKQLEANIVFGPVAGASFSEMEGHVDPVQAVEVLLARARQLGARIEYPCEVTGLDLHGGRLRAVGTTTGDIEGDVLIVACGVDTPRVAAMAGLRVPLKDAPGVLVHTAPMPRALGRIALAPAAHMKQKPDGRVVTGAGFGGTPTTDASREAGERFLQTAASVLPQLRNATLDKVTLGWRPLPKDGYPIVGFPSGRSDVYITVMHSGVTLSPLVARLAALEILDRASVAPLEPYRLSRFTD